MSFCGHAILELGILEVQDASQDPRFCDNTLVTDKPHIRFYTSAPLRSSGNVRGTLCIIYDYPRTLTEDKRLCLRVLIDDLLVGELLFAFRDQGLGIAREFQSHVFEKFALADATAARQSSGTGLCLINTKALVEQIRGCIGIESKPGKGATFWFELPSHAIE